MISDQLRSHPGDEEGEDQEWSHNLPTITDHTAGLLGSPACATLLRIDARCFMSSWEQGSLDWCLLGDVTVELALGG